MPYRPHNEKNSIVEAAFSLSLGSPPSEEALVRVEELAKLLQSELPDLSKVQQVKFELNPQEASTAPVKVVGLDLRKTNATGGIEWTLRVHPKFISANCLAYTRFDEVWARCRRWLEMVSERILDENCVAIAVGVEYIDRFTHEPPDQPSPVTELFRTNTRFINRQILESTALWHTNQGWIAPAPANITERITETPVLALHNLNISAARRSNVVTTTIAHRAEIKSAARGVGATAVGDLFSADENGSSLIDCIARTLHDENKRVLLDLLTDEFADKIGLNDTD